jgi:hypothetical protein
MQLYGLLGYNMDIPEGVDVAVSEERIHLQGRNVGRCQKSCLHCDNLKVSVLLSL